MIEESLCVCNLENDPITPRLCGRKDKTSYEAVRQVLRWEYESLGHMTFAEGVVTVNFVVMALLWMSRSPGFVSGWGELFHPG